MNHVRLLPGYDPSTNGAPPTGPFSQTFVDYFGWQAFIALNWPVDASGAPSKTKTLVTDTTSPRVWSTYKTKDDVFRVPALAALDEACPSVPGKLRLFRTSKFGLSEFGEPGDGQPLIDRQGNFVLYDIRLNGAEVNYLTTNKLTTLSGQKAFNKTYNFPAGLGDKPGAIEIKTSWRIMTDQDDKRKYYTAPATIAVPAGSSASGKPMCIDATVGLVGMHIGQKFTNPTRFSEYWSWSTFEHTLNAPLADKPPGAKRVPVSPLNNLATRGFSPPTCTREPVKADRTAYSFYNNACDAETCPINTPPKQAGAYKWAAASPYAKAYMTPGAGGPFGTQVARCFEIYPSAEAVTATYHATLGTSPWANYMLVGAQWASAHSSEFPSDIQPFPGPIYLTNTTMETYIQTAPASPAGFGSGSCVLCHSKATDAARNPSNFSFLPFSAK
ncbi:hypothetical protein [Methylobacterium sp. Gmos1]